MEHEKYKELLELNVLGELSKEAELELENHLLECDECTKEYEEIKKLFNMVSAEITSMPTEDDLTNARKRLFNTINSEMEKTDQVVKTNINWNKIFLNKFSFGFGTFVLVMLGIFAGYLMFNNTAPVLTANSLDLDKIDRGEVKIADVNFPRKFSETGEFEFKLNNTELKSYKGTLNDIIVQKLLASAINETENPGFKIKTSQSFIELAPSNINPDKQIKKAFIHSLMNDKNPGVRKFALEALSNFQYDEEIRDALIYVLEKDENASNRMSAISKLLSMNLIFPNINEDIKSKLNKSNFNEENEVIKYKTAKLLMGDKSDEK